MNLRDTTTIRSPRRYGWQPDLPDHRDLIYRPLRGIIQPDTMDLTRWCSPTEDQEQEGSCTANAIVGACEFLQIKAGKTLINLSRNQLYYDERAIEGTVSSDSGAMIRDGIKSAAAKGVASEKLWPYLQSNMFKKPSKAVYADAKKHRITVYQRVQTLDDMLNCLASGYPFVYGFTVYSYFESSQMAKTGILKMPKRNEVVLGGHAVLAVGYNMKLKRILTRNSWGVNWGLKGYFWIPFQYISNQNLADDMWKVAA